MSKTFARPQPPTSETIDTVARVLASIDGHLPSYKVHHWYREEQQAKASTLMASLKRYGYYLVKVEDEVL